MKSKSVASAEVVLVKSLIAHETQILVKSQRGQIVDFRLQNNLRARRLFSVKLHIRDGDKKTEIKGHVFVSEVV